MTIPPEAFWGSNHYRNPPLTDEHVRAAESQLGVKLPIGFLDLLRLQNGGYTRGFVFPMKQRTSWAVDHVPLEELNGIVTDRDHGGIHDILLTDYMTNEWGLPPKQVLLTGDGHWWITLDYRRPGPPVVAWLDVEVGQDLVIASSFRDFFAGLVPKSRLTHDG